MFCCATASAKPPAAAPVILAFGDSLTAGYGLEPGLSFPDVIQQQLQRQGRNFRVVNQGVSGDTTSGGLERIQQALALHPAVVILELGANDGLRGLPLTATRANLAKMIGLFKHSGAKVLLAGITLPRNYGPDYIGAFDKIYGDLAREQRVRLVPFLLEGVATNRALMQSDGLHPNAEGTRRVAQTVLRFLTPML